MIQNLEIKVVGSTAIPQSQYSTEVREIPLTIFDRLASDIHIAVLFAFRQPNAPNSNLIEGLLKTLVHFPTLGGQLDENEHHKPCLLLGHHGGGVLVVEAEVGSNLVDHLPLGPSPELAQLHPSIQNPSHLLQVQLNRFQCGGLVMGVTAHHRVADGQSMSSFFITWGKVVHGLGLHEKAHYDVDWLKPRSPPRCDFEHWGVEFQPLNLLSSLPSLTKTVWESHEICLSDKVDNILVHYSADFIKEELKARVPSTFSRFDVVMGHLWRKTTQARGLDSEGSTEVRVAVNGRPRFPSVPPNFFGNLVLNANPRAKVKDLLGGTLADSAQLIHDSVRRINEGYIQSLIDFGEINQGEVLEPVADQEGSSLCPNLEVDSWLGFSFNAVDFGYGGLCGFLPTWVPVEGVVVLIPSLNGHDKGGVNVLVTLFKEHAKVFGQICYLVE